jgi:hypothetical protein
VNESSLKPMSNRKIAFGTIAIVCFCVGAGLYVYGVVILQDNIQAWAAIIGATQGQADGWWIRSFGGATYAMFGALMLWVLGVVFAVIGLVRAERPRWPAIVGLVLCMLPLGLLLFSWGYAAIGHE